MDIKVFPSILKNVEIDLDSLYSPHPNILYLSLEELKIYYNLRVYFFSFFTCFCHLIN